MSKRSAGVEPEGNLGEHVTCMPLPNENKIAHSGFEIQRRHHQEYKTGVSERIMSSKVFLKKLFIKYTCNFPNMTLESIDYARELWCLTTW